MAEFSETEQVAVREYGAAYFLTAGFLSVVLVVIPTVWAVRSAWGILRYVIPGGVQ